MTCTICSRADRELVDQAIVSGEPQRAIASRFGVSRAAVQRHALRHPSPALAAMQADADREADADRDKAKTVLERMEAQYEILATLVAEACTSGHSTTIINASRELRQTAELLARITHELDTRPVQQTINLMSSPDYLAMRAVLFDALMQYPEARQAVAGRLIELESPK